MPTYDAEKANELIADAMAYVGSRPWCDVHALADALLAATQEVERLRKLCGEACDHWEAWMTAEGPGPQPQRDRLAAIRHAAGLGKGE